MPDTKIHIELLDQSKTLLREMLRNLRKGSDPETIAAKLVLSRLAGCDPETYIPASLSFKDANQAGRYIGPLVKALQGERSKNPAFGHAIDAILRMSGSVDTKKIFMQTIAEEIARHCTSLGISGFAASPPAQTGTPSALGA